MTDLRSLAGLGRSLAIYYGRPWRIGRMARFYREFVQPGDIAFDIGAHVGNRSRALRRAGAKVIALEPQALFHRFLEHTLPRDIKVLPLAAGAAPSTGSMSVSRLHPTVSSLASGFAQSVKSAKSFSAVRWDRRQPVEVTTLDSLIERFGQPAFLKIDVEGFEPEVLAGLSRPVACIAFEFLPATPEATRMSIDRIERLGQYRYNVTRGERLAFEMAEWLTADELLRWLSRIGPDERSGDVYARLQGPGISRLAQALRQRTQSSAATESGEAPR